MSGPEERERAVDLYYIPDISMGYRDTPKACRSPMLLILK